MTTLNAEQSARLAKRCEWAQPYVLNESYYADTDLVLTGSRIEGYTLTKAGAFDVIDTLKLWPVCHEDEEGLRPNSCDIRRGLRYGSEHISTADTLIEAITLAVIAMESE